MTRLDIFRVLDLPRIYRLSQALLAPGAEKAITKNIAERTAKLPLAHRILDVGCGPSSWLWRLGLHPIGLDLSATYTAAFRQRQEPVVNASACELPVRDQCFDAVWSVGLLHHLPDEMARRAVNEMSRVCRPGGYIAVFDAVLPEPAWKRPVAYALRKADRGRHVRRQEDLIALLPTDCSWSFERFQYTYTGLELLGGCAIR